MKKIIIMTVILSFISFLLTSCFEEKIIDIEIIEDLGIKYNIGEDIDNLKLSGGKVKVSYESGRTYEAAIEANWIEVKDFINETAIVKVYGKEIRIPIKGINVIKDNNDLIESKNKSGLYFIKEGNYEIDTLRFDNEVSLIGIGNVTITLNGVESGQAAALFQGNTTLVNIDFVSTYSDSLINAVKVAKVSEPNLEKISALYMYDVSIKGGKGLNVMSVDKAEIDKLKVDVESSIKNVAFSVSAGSTILLKNSNINHGSWGSIAIFGVSNDATEEYYKRKNTLNIINTNLTSAVYIEYVSVTKSEIFGLEAWKLTEQNDFKVYTFQE